MNHGILWESGAQASDMALAIHPNHTCVFLSFLIKFLGFSIRPLAHSLIIFHPYSPFQSRDGCHIHPASLHHLGVGQLNLLCQGCEFFHIHGLVEAAVHHLGRERRNIATIHDPQCRSSDLWIGIRLHYDSLSIYIYLRKKTEWNVHLFNFIPKSSQNHPNSIKIP